MAQAVADGKLTQEQADKHKENIEEKTKNMLENAHPGKRFGKKEVKTEAE